MKKLMLIAALAIAADINAADWTNDFKVSETAKADTVSNFVAAQVADSVNEAWKKVALSGYVDVFGSLNTTNTDLTSNGLHLGTFQLSLSSANPAMSQKMYVELGYGENAAVFTSANGGQATPGIQQAYVTQGLGKFSVQVGKFIGFLGYELPDPNSNLNYTRSQIFLSEPVYNIGLVAKYALTDTTNLIAYGVNENSSDVALDGTKDVGASLQSANDTGGFAFNWYRDNSKVIDYIHRDLLNAYGFLVMGKSTVAVEYLHGDVALNSGAAYLSVGSGGISATIRGVYMSNPGVLPGDSSAQYTLTFKQKRGSVTNVAEVIMDSSPVSIYWNSNTKTLQSNQTTLVLSTVYSF